jgi:hypothetical protein
MPVISIIHTVDVAVNSIIGATKPSPMGTAKKRKNNGKASTDPS